MVLWVSSSLIVDGLDTDQVDELLERLTQQIRREIPEVSQTFIEPHPARRSGE